MMQAGPVRTLQVFLVAGEESGDRLGAALMRAIRSERSDVRFRGVGGEKMAAEGMPSAFPLADLALMGFVGIIRRLPAILARIRATADAVIAADPDVLVIIDSPEFTHRVAKRVRAARPKLPIIDYVSPTVWAWRPWRARKMRRYIDHVLALLPFEPAAYRELDGPPCTYVGHPLFERISALRPGNVERARRGAEPPLVLVLPGSRRGEVSRLLDPFGAALRMASERIGAVDLVLPTVPHVRHIVEQGIADWPAKPRVIVGQDEKDAAFRQARAALAASGTVTLELAFAGVPTVAAYRVPPLDAFIARRLVRASSAILPNLILGENVVPEFIQEACTAEALAYALVGVIEDGPNRERQTEAFSRLDEVMQTGAAPPSARAAAVVLAMTGTQTRSSLASG